ncbi:hypothetical protein ACFE04_002440 [Oxalis oulophora]
MDNKLASSSTSSSQINNNKNNVYRDDFESFPPGIRFRPNDKELIVYYLMNKINDTPLPPNEFHEVDISMYNPEDLTKIHKSTNGEEWYFFTYHKRKYPNGRRPNRSAGNGFWKAGTENTVIDKGKAIGLKKTLDFRIGKQPEGKKTDWKMHEYRVDENFIPKDKRTRDGCAKLNDWIVCKIYNSKLNAEDFKGMLSSEQASTSSCHATQIPSQQNSCHATQIPGQQNSCHATQIPGQQNSCHATQIPSQQNSCHATQIPGQQNSCHATQIPSQQNVTIENESSDNSSGYHSQLDLYFNDRPPPSMSDFGFDANGVTHCDPIRNNVTLYDHDHFPNYATFNNPPGETSQHNLTRGEGPLANGHFNNNPLPYPAMYDDSGFNTNGIYIHDPSFPNSMASNNLSAENSLHNLTSRGSLANGYEYLNNNFGCDIHGDDPFSYCTMFSDPGLKTNGIVIPDLSFPNNIAINNSSAETSQVNIASGYNTSNNSGFYTLDHVLNNVTLDNPSAESSLVNFRNNTGNLSFDNGNPNGSSRSNAVEFSNGSQSNDPKAGKPKKQQQQQQQQQRRNTRPSGGGGGGGSNCKRRSQ